MKLNTDIPERNRIINGVFNESDSLTETDTAYHRYSILEAYRLLLHERSVIDDCCRRFERTFRDQPDIVFIT